jgi:hypothetical protein
LADWVHLGEIHNQVSKDHPGFTEVEVQRETLDTIRSLVSDGLVEVGNLAPGGRFAAWDTPLEESLERIAEAYVDKFENVTGWLWVFWLSLTDKGKRVAEALQAQSQG